MSKQNAPAQRVDATLKGVAAGMLVPIAGKAGGKKPSKAGRAEAREQRKARGGKSSGFVTLATPATPERQSTSDAMAEGAQQGTTPVAIDPSKLLGKRSQGGPAMTPHGVNYQDRTIKAKTGDAEREEWEVERNLGQGKSRLAVGPDMVGTVGGNSKKFAIHPDLQQQSRLGNLHSSAHAATNGRTPSAIVSTGLANSSINRITLPPSNVSSAQLSFQARLESAGRSGKGKMIPANILDGGLDLQGADIMFAAALKGGVDGFEGMDLGGRESPTPGFSGDRVLQSGVKRGKVGFGGRTIVAQTGAARDGTKSSEFFHASRAEDGFTDLGGMGGKGGSRIPYGSLGGGDGSDGNKLLEVSMGGKDGLGSGTASTSRAQDRPNHTAAMQDPPPKSNDVPVSTFTSSTASTASTLIQETHPVVTKLITSVPSVIIPASTWTGIPRGYKGEPIPMANLYVDTCDAIRDDVDFSAGRRALEQSAIVSLLELGIWPKSNKASPVEEVGGLLMVTRAAGGSLGRMDLMRVDAEYARYILAKPSLAMFVGGLVIMGELMLGGFTCEHILQSFRKVGNRLQYLQPKKESKSAYWVALKLIFGLVQVMAWQDDEELLARSGSPNETRFDPGFLAFAAPLSLVTLSRDDPADKLEMHTHCAVYLFQLGEVLSFVTTATVPGFSRLELLDRYAQALRVFSRLHLVGTGKVSTFYKGVASVIHLALAREHRRIAEKSPAGSLSREMAAGEAEKWRGTGLAHERSFYGRVAATVRNDPIAAGQPWLLWILRRTEIYADLTSAAELANAILEEPAQTLGGIEYWAKRIVRKVKESEGGVAKK